MRILALGQSMLKKKTGLGRNIFWVVVSRFGTQGLMVLFTLVLARRLGNAAFGAYSFIAAVVFVGNALTTFGTDMLLIREIAGRDDQSQLFPALLIQLALSAGFIAIVWVGAPFLPNQSPDSVLGLQIYVLALLPLSFFSVFTTTLRGKQRMDSYMALNLGVSTLQFTAIWVSVRPGGSIPWLTEVLVAVQCAGALLGGILCAVQIPGFWKVWHFSWHNAVELVHASAPIAVIALTAMLYQKISVYMVATLIGPAPTGWFSAAQRVIEASKTIHLAVFTALYPVMAEASKTVLAPGQAGAAWKKPWQGPFQRSWKLLIAGAVAAALGISIFAGPLTQILYGPEYMPAVAGLRELCFILIPFTVNTFFSLVMLAYRKEQVVLRVQLAGLVMLVGLNAWWIPIWGVEGACLAFVAAESVQSLLYLFSREIGLPGRRMLTRTSLNPGVGAGNQAQKGIPEQSGEQV